MSVPGFQEFMLPALQSLAKSSPQHWRSVGADVVRALKISEKDQQESLANGRTVVDDRVQWTMTHLYQAGLVERPERGMYSLSPEGHAVLDSRPTRVDMKFLSQYPSYIAFRNRSPSVTDEGELRVELDRDGASAGTELEVEVDLDDVRIVEPFDPDQIDVITRTPTIGLLMARILRGSIDLQPDFQRQAGIWRPESQSRLIESLLLRIPLPTFYVSEGADEAWSVIDGVQRLTSITRFVEPSGTEFGQLRLTGLEYLRQYDGFTFGDLPGFLQTRLVESEVVVHVVRQGTPDDVKFNIFARLNTGGLPLTGQEIRHALIGGQARDFLEQLAHSQAFLDATLGSVSPRRMADREMCLRFIAFRANSLGEYRYQDFDLFLRRAMSDLNYLDEAQLADLREDFFKGLSRAELVFGPEAFRKPNWGERLNPINKALFEVETVGLARLTDSEFNALLERSEEFYMAFAEALNERPDFYRSISVSTGSVSNVSIRFEAFDGLVGTFINGGASD